MRMTIRALFWLGVLLTLSAVGCAYHAPPNPNAPVLQSLASAKQKVTSATTNLEKTPPDVPAAKTDLKDAGKSIDTATTQTQVASTEYDKVAKKVADDEVELNKFFSRKQRALFWWGVILVGLFGTLAAVGNFFPGWWSLPALWLMKGARFVIFGGIPHLVNGIVWLWQKMFNKPPATT